MHFHGVALCLFLRTLRCLHDLVDHLIEGMPVVIEQNALGRQSIGRRLLKQEFRDFNGIAIGAVSVQFSVFFVTNFCSKIGNVSSFAASGTAIKNFSTTTVQTRGDQS